MRQSCYIRQRVHCSLRALWPRRWGDSERWARTSVLWPVPYSSLMRFASSRWLLCSVAQCTDSADLIAAAPVATLAASSSIRPLRAPNQRTARSNRSGRAKGLWRGGAKFRMISAPRDICVGVPENIKQLLTGSVARMEVGWMGGWIDRTILKHCREYFSLKYSYDL